MVEKGAFSGAAPALRIAVIRVVCARLAMRPRVRTRIGRHTRTHRPSSTCTTTPTVGCPDPPESPCRDAVRPGLFRRSSAAAHTVVPISPSYARQGCLAMLGSVG